jgi:uncharacterized protein YbjT (DUF2867 family)
VSRVVAVTGATGRQGGAVARALANSAFEIRKLTRNPNKPGQVRCDLEEVASVRAALSGVDALFLTTTPYEHGTDAEERQARNAIEAAREMGVRQIVYSSVADARAGTGVAHYESKGRVESLLDDAGFAATTILRPTFFMDMFLDPPFRRALANGGIKMAMRPDTRIAMVAVDDIAAFAKLAFQQPESLNGHVIELAGDNPTMEQLASAMAAVLGRQIDYRQVAPEQMPADVRPKLATQRWLEDVGWRIDTLALAAAYPVPLTSLAEWAERYRKRLDELEEA